MNRIFIAAAIAALLQLLAAYEHKELCDNHEHVTYSRVRVDVDWTANQSEGAWRISAPHTLAVFVGYWRVNYPPKLSKWMLSGSTPRLKSMFSTALLMGPGPHM